MIDKETLMSNILYSGYLGYQILCENDMLGLSMMETALKINNIEHPNMFTKQGKISKKFKVWGKKHLLFVQLSGGFDSSGKYPDSGFFYVENMVGNYEKITCLFTTTIVSDMYRRLCDLRDVYNSINNYMDTNKGGE